MKTEASHRQKNKVAKGLLRYQTKSFWGNPFQSKEDFYNLRSQFVSANGGIKMNNTSKQLVFLTKGFIFKTDKQEKKPDIPVIF